MDPLEVQEYITQISQNSSRDFQSKSVITQEEVDNWPIEIIIEHLNGAGVIPECFGHDSTEEKLYAKYCDALVTRFLREIGFDSRLITERADAADVIANTQDYTVVADAKAFRLSRTAKNQKDFKVESLNSWRQGAEYACLVSPLYQYPSITSQIYSQAIRYNVTLISYTHLVFMLTSRENMDHSIEDLWNVGRSLEVSKSASSYWHAIEDTIKRLFHGTDQELLKAKKYTNDHLKKQAEKQVDFWEAEKKRIKSLPHDKAVSELIKALKIDARIATIQRTAGM